MGVRAFAQRIQGRWLKRLSPGSDILLGGRNVRSLSVSSAVRLKPVIGALQFGQQSPAAHTSRASVQ